MFGREAGDAVIAHTTQVLPAVFRATDLVARTHDDEFIVLMKDVSSLDAIECIAELVLQLLRCPCGTQEHAVEATVSVGIAMSDGQTPRTFNDLYDNACTALFDAKRAKDHRFVIYDCNGKPARGQYGFDRLVNASTPNYQPFLDTLANGGVLLRAEPKGSFVPQYFSDSFLALLGGMAREEALSVYGDDMVAGMHPDDRQRMRDEIKESLSAETPLRTIARMRKAGGGYVWVSIFAVWTRENVLRMISEGAFQLTKEFRREDAGRIRWTSFVAHIVENPLSHHMIAFVYIADIERRHVEVSFASASAKPNATTGLYSKESLERIEASIADLRKAYVDKDGNAHPIVLACDYAVEEVSEMRFNDAVTRAKSACRVNEAEPTGSLWSFDERVGQMRRAMKPGSGRSMRTVSAEEMNRPLTGTEREALDAAMHAMIMANNYDEAITNVLGVLGQAYHAHRVFTVALLENGMVAGLHEWREPGAPPIIGQMMGRPLKEYGTLQNAANVEMPVLVERVHAKRRSATDPSAHHAHGRHHAPAHAQRLRAVRRVERRHAFAEQAVGGSGHVGVRRPLHLLPRRALTRPQHHAVVPARLRWRRVLGALAAAGGPQDRRSGGFRGACALPDAFGRDHSAVGVHPPHGGGRQRVRPGLLRVRKGARHAERLGRPRAEAAAGCREPLAPDGARPQLRCIDLGADQPLRCARRFAGDRDHRIDGRFKNMELRGAMEALRGQGFRFALDELGSEYPTLSAMSDLPFDTVKLDRLLVRRFAEDSMSRSIVEGIARACEKNGIRCVAEGVEFPSYIELLVSMGCHYGQGYCFARPMTIDQFTNEYLVDANEDAERTIPIPKGDGEEVS